ncbi:molybdenum cofactor biosynthesis protein [Ammoniphilus oxalaticus]|uniref:Molybdenum cofactor biosynthesis protein n=1 Tax=Ammoniphilus oxalaticus TaxID=66863 RepID=A0A419SR38_9BACL|nr:molybdopterin adenylyltransferase [Ammoniphilus oxalaticus]RKD27008.1 molybdenum cofactor biosynthesis protein [Ammoniphilus oxalaticus]
MEWKVGVLTISDKGSRGEREDQSGVVLQELVQGINGQITAYEIIPDEQPLIEQKMIELSDQRHCELILTTGGTGFAARDVTPEATKAVIDKEAPGLAERMRAATLVHTKFAILSRATSGIRGNTLIINLPGSPKGVRECFESIQDVLPHALQILRGNTEHEGGVTK